VTSRRVRQPAGSFASLGQVVRRHAQESPDRRALVFLPDGEREAGQLTYAELDARVRTLAARLQSAGMAGERVLLLLPSGLDYVVAFLACLAAGAVAVPVFAPARSRHLDRITRIATDCGARLVVTDSPSLAAVRSHVEPLLGHLPGTAVWTAGDPAPAAGAEWVAPQHDLDGLAYLQYTSGSTSSPRGVMVTNRSLLHQARLATGGMQLDRSDVHVTWLPLFHDLGLVLGVLVPLSLGSTIVLMPPVAFIQRPLRWLAAIDRHRATVSHGPTFAFDLCTRRVGADDRGRLDLSTWRVSGVGAEPVRADTLERFTRAFAAQGFRLETLTPGYGLAEATLIVANRDRTGPVTISDVDADALAANRVEPASPASRLVRRLVSNGRPLGDTEVAIVDPDAGRRLPAGAVGEVWVRGDTVAAGYWDRPEETAAVFGCRLAGGDGPYLRTGDLGALRDGHLYITGRSQDLIVVRGRNHYPHDLELTVSLSHEALATGRGAAFTVEVQDEERLVVVHELDRSHLRTEPDEIVQRVRRAVAEEHELTVGGVVLLRPGGLPVTSSGKIQRGACRDRYLGGELDVAHAWSAGAEREAAGPAAEPDSSPPAAVTARPAGEIAAWLTRRISTAARLPAAQSRPASRSTPSASTRSPSSRSPASWRSGWGGRSTPPCSFRTRPSRAWPGRWARRRSPAPPPARSAGRRRRASRSRWSAWPAGSPAPGRWSGSGPC